MQPTTRRLTLWAPRVLGIAVALFLGLFALDAVDEGLVAFLVHLTPTLLLLLTVAAAWQIEWIGAAVFIQLAALYGLYAWSRIDWILIVAGPLVAVGLLFVWNWRHHDALRA